MTEYTDFVHSCIVYGLLLATVFGLFVASWKR